VADGRYLPYQNVFDLVVSFNALHWIPEQELALQSIHRALKPSARAILRFVAKGDRQSIEATIEELRELSEWKSYFQEFKPPFFHLAPEEYRRLAADQGLEVVSQILEAKAWDFKTREAFLAYCQTTLVAWTQYLPEERKQAFIVEVLDRYRAIAADNPNEDNTFKFYQLSVELVPRP
jgi:trans-aconitate 2-methyltransferase